MSNTDRLQEKIKEKLNRAIEFEANGFILSVKEVSGLISQLEQAQAEYEALEAVAIAGSSEIHRLISENEQLKADKQKLVAGYDRLSNFPYGMYSSDYMHQFARQVLSEVKGNG